MGEKFTLKHPVTVGGQTISELELRRPKNADLETMDARKGGNITKSILLYADLAGVDPKVIRELDTEDMGQLNAWAAPILDPNGQASGGGGS